MIIFIRKIINTLGLKSFLNTITINITTDRYKNIKDKEEQTKDEHTYIHTFVWVVELCNIDSPVLY